MNRQTMTDVLEILNSLPRFEEFGYFYEPVINVQHKDGEIVRLEFPAGHLERVKTNTPQGRQYSWVLNNSLGVTSVFVPEV